MLDHVPTCDGRIAGISGAEKTRNAALLEDEEEDQDCQPGCGDYVLRVDVWRLEPSFDFLIRFIEDQDSTTHKHESKKGSDAREVGDFGEVHEQRGNGDYYAGDDRRKPRRLEALVDGREDGRKQAIAAHRHPYARLAQLKYEKHGGHGDHRADGNDPCDPGEVGSFGTKDVGEGITNCEVAIALHPGEHE